MKSLSTIAIIVAALVLIYTETGNGSCELKQVTLKYEISGCARKIKLGKRKICKNDDGCVSSQSFGFAVDSAASSEMTAKYCVPDAYEVRSGSFTQAQVRAKANCNSYNGGVLDYKYASATSCVCERIATYYP